MTVPSHRLIKHLHSKQASLWVLLLERVKEGKTSEQWSKTTADWSTQ